MAELTKIAIGVVAHEDNVLLVKRVKEETAGNQRLSWVFPGGQFTTESPEAACIREVIEEAGVIVNPVTTIHEGKHPDFPVYTHYLGCMLVVDMELEIEDPQIEAKLWVPRLQIVQYVTSAIHPKVQDYLNI